MNNDKGLVSDNISALHVYPPYCLKEYCRTFKHKGENDDRCYIYLLSV